MKTLWRLGGLFLAVAGAAAVAPVFAEESPTLEMGGLPNVPVEMFGYEAGAPAVRVLGTEQRGEAEVADVEIGAEGPLAPVIKAYVVRPPGAGPFAGILWVHWLGDPSTTNRTQYLDEAVALAKTGAVSVLVEAMWAEPKWYRNRKFERDRADHVAQVVALRRALDALLAQPGVDPQRIGFVGHDYGAMHGALMAGVDLRVRAYVFIAGTPSMLDWAYYAAKPADPAAYEADMKSIELKDYLARLVYASVLQQYAEHDEYIPLAKAEAFFTATGGRKQMIVYGGASHAMNEVPAIRQDRMIWLRRHLQLR